MKNKLLRSLLLLAVASSFQSNATVYFGVDFPEGELSFADEVVAVNPGATGSDPAYASQVLGSDTVYNHYYSLGHYGSITIKFTDNVLLPSGDNTLDLWIFETDATSHCSGRDGEPIDVEISHNGTDWVSVGSTPGCFNGIDIDQYLGQNPSLYTTYNYVRITDKYGQTGAGTGGADISFVGTIGCNSFMGENCADSYGKEIDTAKLEGTSLLQQLAVLRVNANAQPEVEIYDYVANTTQKKINFLDANYLPKSLVSLRKGKRQNQGYLGVMAHHRVTGDCKIEIRNISDGALFQTLSCD